MSFEKVPVKTAKCMRCKKVLLQCEVGPRGIERRLLKQRINRRFDDVVWLSAFYWNLFAISGDDD